MCPLHDRYVPFPEQLWEKYTAPRDSEKGEKAHDQRIPESAIAWFMGGRFKEAGHAHQDDRCGLDYGIEGVRGVVLAATKDVMTGSSYQPCTTSWSTT
jgi:hypothetical protein